MNLPLVLPRNLDIFAEFSDFKEVSFKSPGIFASFFLSDVTELLCSLTPTEALGMLTSVCLSVMFLVLYSPLYLFIFLTPVSILEYYKAF